MIPLITMFASAVVLLAAGLYLSIAMGAEAAVTSMDAASASEPRLN